MIKSMNGNVTLDEMTDSEAYQRIEEAYQNIITNIKVANTIKSNTSEEQNVRTNAEYLMKMYIIMLRGMYYEVNSRNWGTTDYVVLKDSIEIDLITMTGCTFDDSGRITSKREGVIETVDVTTCMKTVKKLVKNKSAMSFYKDVVTLYDVLDKRYLNILTFIRTKSKFRGKTSYETYKNSVKNYNDTLLSLEDSDVINILMGMNTPEYCWLSVVEAYKECIDELCEEYLY